MLVPILCYTCGMPLGDKAEFFEILKKEKLAKVKIIKPNMDIDYSDILKRLDISNDCCKMHIISAVLISEYY